MAVRLSMRDAVNKMCRQCIYDPLSRGTWREQVKECSSISCPLHPIRPLPIGAARVADCTGKAKSPTAQQQPDAPGSFEARP